MILRERKADNHCSLKLAFEENFIVYSVISFLGEGGV